MGGWRTVGSAVRAIRLTNPGAAGCYSCRQSRAAAEDLSVDSQASDQNGGRDAWGDRFVRIESVAKVEDGSLRVLDLADPAVRAEVRAFQGGKVTAVYQSERSRPYP